jgi:hypothetical protein
MWFQIPSPELLAFSDLVLLSTRTTSFCSIYTRALREGEGILTSSFIFPSSSLSTPPRRLVLLHVSSAANVCGDEIHSIPASELPSYLSTTDPNLHFSLTSLTLTLGTSQPANPSPPATTPRPWRTYRRLGEYRKVL